MGCWRMMGPFIRWRFWSSGRLSLFPLRPPLVNILYVAPIFVISFGGYAGVSVINVWMQNYPKRQVMRNFSGNPGFRHGDYLGDFAMFLFSYLVVFDSVGYKVINKPTSRNQVSSNRWTRNFLRMMQT